MSEALIIIKKVQQSPKSFSWISKNMPLIRVFFFFKKLPKDDKIWYEYSFYFSDAVTTERAVELAANTKGLCYIRLSRPATEVSFNNMYFYFHHL